MDLAKIQYYSLLINYRKNDLETKMLLNLHKSNWDQGFKNKNCNESRENNNKRLDTIIDLCSKYSDWINSELNKSTNEVKLKSVGKFNPRNHLEKIVEESITDNLNKCLTTMMNTIIF